MAAAGMAIASSPARDAANAGVSAKGNALQIA